MSITSLFKRKRYLRADCKETVCYKYSYKTGVVRCEKGKEYETTLVFRYYSVYRKMTYYVWIDEINERNDNVLEVRIGCSDSKTIVNGYEILIPVNEQYDKMKVVVELISHGLD